MLVYIVIGGHDYEGLSEPEYAGLDRAEAEQVLARVRAERSYDTVYLMVYVDGREDDTLREVY